MRLRSHRGNLLLSNLTARAGTRWQPVFLVAGALALVIGLLLRSSVAVVLGMLVMGSAAPGLESHSSSAATVRTWMWLHKNRADNR